MHQTSHHYLIPKPTWIDAEEEWASYKSLQDSVLHIDLRNWADICLVAPLSAHTLAKISNGMCDDLLSCCLRAWDYGQRQSSLKGKQVILAPAMNTAMWDHLLTRQQLETIKKFSTNENGVVVVEPAVKTLACGEIGAGALAELDDIISTVKKCLVHWDTNDSATQENHKERKQSMKHAILQYSKQRFSEMKISNEQQNYVAPISPTPNTLIETVLPRLNLDASSLLVDLGCGDGRWLLAANKHSRCKCLGIDVDEERLKIANDSIRENNLQERVQVRQQDVFDFVRRSNDFYKVNVLIMYLFRDAMLDMSSLLQQRLDLRESVKKDKMQILCVGFKLPGWTCIIHEEKVNKIQVYLYEI